MQGDRRVAVDAGVEGRVHLDEARLAVEQHELAQRHLGGAVEGQVEAVERGPHAGVAVGAEIGIDVDRRLHPQRLGAGHHARHHGRVDADVAQAAAAHGRQVAQVGRIAVEIGIAALHLAQAADGAVAHELADLGPLRMVEDGEGLADQQARDGGRGGDRLHLGGRHGQRLLAQHVLAGGEGLQRPFEVQRVGQRQVDAVDLGRGEQFLVAGVDVRDRMAPGERAGAVQVACGDRGEVAVGGLLDRRDDVVAGYLGDGQQSPAEHRKALSLYGHPSV